MTIKNKKAQTFLGEHVMNLVLAALAIVVLLLLGVGIFNIFLRQATDSQKASGTLDNIIESINQLKKEGDSRTFPVYNPEGWAINYQGNTAVVGKLPVSCGNEPCICICKYSLDSDELFNNCNGAKTGVCSKFSEKYVSVVPYICQGADPDVCEKSIKIDKVLSINVSMEKGGAILIKKMR